MLQGFYHSIDTFGAVDGRGIRYVLFLSGCELGCEFCHNPDTWEQGRNTISVEEILKDIRRYRRFYDASNGGITVSGGEPLLQADFVAELFKHCRRENVHTTLDTSGYAPQNAIRKVLPYSNAVLFSLKAANSATHRKLTGKDNALILNNLNLAASLSKVTVRYVIIPGINNSHAEITDLSKIIRKLPQLVAVELLPYHTLGRSKWDQLGKPYPLPGIPPADENDVHQVRQWLQDKNIITC